MGEVEKMYIIKKSKIKIVISISKKKAEVRNMLLKYI